MVLDRHARDVVLHMSHDAWVEEEKQDIAMAPMSNEEVTDGTSGVWQSSAPFLQFS